MPEFDDAEQACGGDAADEAEAADDTLVGERDQGRGWAADEFLRAQAQTLAEGGEAVSCIGCVPLYSEAGGRRAVRGRAGLCHRGRPRRRDRQVARHEHRFS